MSNFMIQKLKDLKIESIVLFLLIALYSISRITFIDSDIPTWEKSHYSPIDELYYTSQAFDIIEGVHSPHGKPLTPQFSAINIIQQLTTAGALFLFGDNYYGLRAPSVFAGLAVLLFFYLIILKRFGLAYAASFSVLLASEQSFMLATRIAEPTIFRMAASAALIFFFIKQDHTKRSHLLALGAATCFAWLFIYPTNIFLGLFGLIMTLLSNPKKTMTSASYYLAGFFLCGLFYIFIYYSLGNTAGDILTTKNTFSERVSSGSNIELIKQAILKLITIRQASFFSSNPVFLIATLLSTALMSVLFITRSKLLTKADRTLFVFCACFLLQCAFVNDYPERKLVFILPIFIYFCMFSTNIILSKAPVKISFLIGATTVITSTVLLSTATFNSIYRDPQYSYKNAMEELRSLNNERVIGGWGFGFRLYNNYKPYLNQYVLIYSNPKHYYKLLNEAGKNGDAKYTIEYGDDSTEEKMKLIDFRKEKLAFKSNDPIYPDLYIYKFSESN